MADAGEIADGSAAGDSALGRPGLRLSLVRAVSLTSGLAGHFKAYAAAAQSALPRGHGVAAEHASHLLDRVRGRVVAHLGSDNARCGPDRLVDGVLIQTKYCSSGRGCIADCFDKTGFRYLLADGRPMQIEVPRDLYGASVQAMESRIARGQVPGVSDPAEAARIVRRGLLTYEQARRLGRAGTVESLLFDVATGIRTSAMTSVMTATVRFAHAASRGRSFVVSAGEAARAAASAGATTYLSFVITKQAGRTALDAALTPASQWVVSKCSPSVIRALATASGRPLLLGGAAAGHVARILRGNVISGAATGLVLSSLDLYRAGRGRLSKSEAARRIVNTNAGIAGGTAGWFGGAATGAAAGSIVPGLGTGVGVAVGGLVGSLGGSAACSYVSTAAMRVIIRERPPALYVAADENFAAAAAV